MLEWLIDLGPVWLTVILFSSLVVALAAGLPLVFALGGVATFFVIFIWGPNALAVLANRTYMAMNMFVLLAVPMFIFMGAMLQKAGIAEDLYNMMYHWMGGLRGGLASGTVLICTLFAAIVGISGAATVTMGLLALPSMLKRGYKKDIALGSVSAGGALGILIPPPVENIESKKKLFAELDRICPTHTILATNTSSQCVIEIAAATRRMDKVLGFHFFNPAPVMKLLEVIKTIATSENTLKMGKEFGESLGKTVVVAKDTPGFIINRLLTPFLLSVIRMLEAEIASRDDIDNVVRLGLGHPMGPLQLADLVGLDTVYYAANTRYEELKEPQYAPPPLLKRMVVTGWLGRKAGKGFYEYE